MPDTKTKARWLSTDEFESRAKPVLNAVFRHLTGYEPFQPAVAGRLVIETPSMGFWLSEEQFDGIASAASSVGDASAFYSFVHVQDLVQYYTWEVPLTFYGYYDAEEGENLRQVEGHEIHIPLDRALYSPSGKWGVHLPDNYAAIGGSEQFLEHFRNAHPVWHDDADAFLARCNAKSQRGVDMAWARTLLRHAYGDNAPEI